MIDVAFTNDGFPSNRAFLADVSSSGGEYVINLGSPVKFSSQVEFNIIDPEDENERIGFAQVITESLRVAEYSHATFKVSQRILPVRDGGGDEVWYSEDNCTLKQANSETLVNTRSTVPIYVARQLRLSDNPTFSSIKKRSKNYDLTKVIYKESFLTGLMYSEKHDFHLLRLWNWTASYKVKFNNGTVLTNSGTLTCQDVFSHTPQVRTKIESEAESFKINAFFRGIKSSLVANVNYDSTWTPSTENPDVLSLHDRTTIGPTRNALCTSPQNRGKPCERDKFMPNFCTFCGKPTI